MSTLSFIFANLPQSVLNNHPVKVNNVLIMVWNGINAIKQLFLIHDHSPAGIGHVSANLFSSGIKC